jgi:hypothetical protein
MPYVRTIRPTHTKNQTTGDGLIFLRPKYIQDAKITITNRFTREGCDEQA